MSRFSSAGDPADSLCGFAPAGTQASTIGDVLRWRALHQPERVSHVFLANGDTEGGRITYRGLDVVARAIGARLQETHTPGDRALLLYPPGLEFVAAFFGCLHAGLVAVPVYLPRNRSHTPRIQAILRDAGSSLALTTAKTLDGLRVSLETDPGFPGLEWLATDTIPAGLAESWTDPGSTAKTLALLQYTSGSTGTPRGVMVSHDNILYNSLYIQQAFSLSERSVSVSWLPSFHDMGLIDGVIQPLYTGFPGVLLPPLSFIQRPFRWLTAITRYRGTHAGGPNFGYDLCVEKVTTEQIASLDLSCLESLYNGAEPVRRATLERFIDRFAACGFRRKAFYPCFGLAEATLMVSGGDVASDPVYLSVDKSELAQGRIREIRRTPDRSIDLVGCGRAILQTAVRIVDPETRKTVPPFTVGEVWVSGPTVCEGYWRSEETHEVFDGRITGENDRPYLRTGDLGFLVAQELFIAGRLKDVIIINGSNHYPQDIEWTAQHAHADLRSGGGAAFSVEVNGEERLVVVQELERMAQRKPAVDDIAREVVRAIAEEHGVGLHALVLIKTGTVPKTSSGKIQRRTCRHRFLRGDLAVVDSWTRQATES